MIKEIKILAIKEEAKKILRRKGVRKTNIVSPEVLEVNDILIVIINGNIVDVVKKTKEDDRYILTNIVYELCKQAKFELELSSSKRIVRRKLRDFITYYSEEELDKNCLELNTDNYDVCDTCKYNDSCHWKSEYEEMYKSA